MVLTCKSEGGKAEYKGIIKWYPVDVSKRRGPSSRNGTPSAYVYFKLEGHPTKSVAHTVKAFKRYVLKREKDFSVTRREDDNYKTDMHIRDPKAASIDGETVCCEADDRWNHLNNEYFLCGKLVRRFMLLSSDVDVDARLEEPPVSTVVKHVDSCP